MIKYIRDVMSKMQRKSDHTVGAGIARPYRGAIPLVIPVTERAALQVPVFFSAVSVLAQSIAMLPLIVYRRDGENNRSRAIDTPEYQMLKSRVNADMTSYEWRFATVLKMILRGAAYSLILRDSQDRAAAMRFINHRYAETDGLNYHFRLTDGSTVTYRHEDVLRVTWFITGDDAETYGHCNGALDFCTESLGFLIAAERYGKSFFSRGALPFVLLIHPGEITPEAEHNIVSSWREKFENYGHQVGVVQENMQVKLLEVKNNEAQFLELRNFQIQEIARFFRITPHKLQDLQRATFSNVTELNQSFVIDTLMPLCTNIQQRIQLSVFRGREDLFAEFLFDDLLRGNVESRYQAYRVAVQNRLLTVDEVRHLENRNSLTDEEIARMKVIMDGVAGPVGREAAAI